MSNDSEEFIFATLYRKRWLMLFLFCCTSLCNAYHWINLSIISDRVLVVWNATIPGSTEVARRMAVDWISLVYFVTYIPLIFPAFLVLNRFGLRVTNVTAAVLNTLGSWLKCVACVLATHTLNSASAPGLVSSAYPLLMTAQTIEAVAQLFVLGIPSPLASTWFGERELSTATSIGVLANQLGTALGFAIPPLIVGTSYTAENNTIGERNEQMHREMEYLLYGSAAFTTLFAIPVILLFKERPPTAPSLAESLRLTKRNRRKSIGSGGTMLVSASYIGEICTDGSWSIQQQLKSICTNRSFLLLTLCYGTNTGVAYAWSILLNVILQQYFPLDAHIGWIGFTMITAGIPGSILIGIILDKTRRFKLTTTTICGLAVVSMGGFTGSLLLRSYYLAYVTSFLFGFTITGLLPTGFQFAAELTYPTSDGLTSGLLNASAQLFGIIFTMAARQLASEFDIIYTNILFICLLGFGFLFIVFTKEDLKRSRMQRYVVTSKETCESKHSADS